MAKNQESINNQLENFLRAPERRYNPETFDSSGKETIPNEAEVFRFRFIKDGEDYGPVTISLDGLNQITVYYGDKVANSPTAPSDGSESWHKFIKALSYWAYRHGLGFELEDEMSLGSDMAKRAHKQKMSEGYYPVNKKTSYSDNIPSVTMRIQHSREMMEGEQRFRNINKIFFETQEGERILSPTNKPGLARTFARHLAEGGKANDDRWNHIVGLCEEYNKMAGFVRATKAGQFNESVQRLISEGVNHYQSLRETLHKIAGKKGYSNYFESWTPALMEDEEQVDLSEMFMTSSLDPRIESVMPILGKLSKNITEDKLEEADMFEQWATSVIEGEQDLEEAGRPVQQHTKKELAQAAASKKKAEQPPTKGMSNAEKADKGWRNPNMKEEQVNEMDSEGYKGTRDDYELGKGKEHTGKPVTANKAKKDFAKMFQKNIDKANKAKQDTDTKVAQHQVKEGQSELESLLKLLGK